MGRETSLVLAIEPDSSRAEALRQMMRERLGVELVLVSSPYAAIVAMNRQLPELLLFSSSLSDRNQNKIIAHYRSLTDGIDPQTLIIPLFRDAAEEKKNSRFSFKWKSQSRGASSDVFLDTVGSYLKRATAAAQTKAAEAQAAGVHAAEAQAAEALVAEALLAKADSPTLEAAVVAPLTETVAAPVEDTETATTPTAFVIDPVVEEVMVSVAAEATERPAVVEPEPALAAPVIETFVAPVDVEFVGEEVALDLSPEINGTDTLAVGTRRASSTVVNRLGAHGRRSHQRRARHALQSAANRSRNGDRGRHLGRRGSALRVHRPQQHARYRASRLHGDDADDGAGHRPRGSRSRDRADQARGRTEARERTRATSSRSRSAA